MKILRFENVSFSYPRITRGLSPLASFGSRPPIIPDIVRLRIPSFELGRGDRLGVLGRNGAGKTTFLKLASGIFSPKSGTVYRSVTVQYVSQIEPLNRWKQSLDEVLYDYTILMRIPKSNRDPLVKEILSLCELSYKKDEIFETLSTGERSRISIVAQLIRCKGILISDEGIGTTDLSFQKKFNEILNQNLTDLPGVVLASHNLPLIRRLCNRTIVLNEGSILFDGSVEDGISYYTNLFET